MSSETMETGTDQGSRPMPDFVKKGLIQVQGGLLYLKASHRVLWMRHEHPGWAIITNIEFADYEKGFVVVKATILDDKGNILATAHAEESRGKLPYLRKAETGSIARALALCGYGTQFGELEDDAEEIADSPRAAASGSRRQASARPGSLNTGPGTCSSCRAPSGKPHGSGCAEAMATA